MAIRTYDQRDFLTERDDTQPATCPACNGSGVERHNVVRDVSTNTVDYDERDCTPCAGTGSLPAPELYETYTMPGSTDLRWKCLGCLCSVNPLEHLPFSEDCQAAAYEREYSMRDHDAMDPWADR